MATHYDVLGVTPAATVDEIRRAYHARARLLHPDAYAGRPESERVAAGRAMGEINEAWRVLRTPAGRAAYDQSLHAAPPPPSSGPVDDDDDPWFDRAYPRAVAEPGDVTLAVVRAAPWIAVLVVLAVIFVFTAFARNGTGEPNQRDLIGECVVTTNAMPERVPCTEPNDGRVVAIVEQPNQCTVGSTPSVAATGEWYCLRAGAEDEPG